MESPVWFWSAFVATGVLLVVLAWYGNRRRRLSPVEAEASEEDLACGRCGYSVFGLPGEVCPECGANLNEVGLTTSKFRRWQNAPPVLRAVVWTLGVAVVATPILVTAFTEFLPTTRVRTMAQPFGTPEVMRVTERHVDRSSGRMFGLMKPREDVSHTVLVVSADGSARLTWDVMADEWTLETPTTSSTGVGRPSLESIERMTVAVTGRPATRPATVESVPVNAAGLVVQPPPPEAVRAFLHWRIRGSPAAYSRQQSRRLVQEQPPEHWISTLDNEAVRRMHSCMTGLVNSETERRSPLLLAVAVGWWPLLWLAGLPLVLRRRAVRVQSHDQLTGQDTP